MFHPRHAQTVRRIACALPVLGAAYLYKAGDPTQSFKHFLFLMAGLKFIASGAALLASPIIRNRNLSRIVGIAGLLLAGSGGFTVGAAYRNSNPTPIEETIKNP